jgi:hypothetical protein
LNGNRGHMSEERRKSAAEDYVANLRGSQKRERLFSTWLFVVSLISALGGVFILFRGGQEASISKSEGLFEFRRFQALLIQQSNDLESVKVRLDALTALPTNAIGTVTWSSLDGDIKTLDARVRTIESAVLNNPTLALSLPLLRQDLENVKSDYRKDAENTVKEIDRVYDQNKWFMGLFITTTFSILGLAGVNLFFINKRQ